MARGQLSSTLRRRYDLLLHALTPGWRALSCPQTLITIYFALHVGSSLLLLVKQEGPWEVWEGEEMAVLPAGFTGFTWLFKCSCFSFVGHTM